MPSENEDQWTEHDGKDCPLGDDVQPCIRFRNGSTIPGGFLRASEIKSFWTWTDPPSGYDVVAYLCEGTSEPAS